MNINLAKTDSLMRAIAADLKLRLAGSDLDTMTEARDADGYMYLMISDGGAVTAGNPVIYLKIKAASVQPDALGIDMAARAPHIAILAYELDGTVPEPSALDLAKVQMEVVKRGVRMQIRQIADATAVTNANAEAAAVAADLPMDMYWPMAGV